MRFRIEVITREIWPEIAQIPSLEADPADALIYAWSRLMDRATDLARDSIRMHVVPGKEEANRQ